MYVLLCVCVCMFVHVCEHDDMVSVAPAHDSLLEEYVQHFITGPLRQAGVETDMGVFWSSWATYEEGAE